MNFILAIGLFSIIFYFIGTPTTKVGRVKPYSPAQYAGIQEGDIIDSISGQK